MIRRDAKQVAVLLVFPEGVAIDSADSRARQMIDMLNKLRPGQGPALEQVVVFNPDMGGVVIYQP